jgi:hypothetical protein
MKKEKGLTQDSEQMSAVNKEAYEKSVQETFLLFGYNEQTLKNIKDAGNQPYLNLQADSDQGLAAPEGVRRIIMNIIPDRRAIVDKIKASADEAWFTIKYKELPTKENTTKNGLLITQGGTVVEPLIYLDLRKGTGDYFRFNKDEKNQIFGRSHFVITKSICNELRVILDTIKDNTKIAYASSEPIVEINYTPFTLK